MHGENIAAAVVLRQPVTIRDLRAFLSSRLAPHKIPTRYLKLDELPRNRSGKVLKGELRDKLAVRPGPGPVPARSEREPAALYQESL